MGEQTFFAKNFLALSGFEPMRWQSRLFEQFKNSTIPGALDLPTGLGKTSVMVIWWIARSLNRALPRRLVYVVDRRAVVDQATTVADEVRSKSGDGALRISTLRGQHVDNREWLNDPSASAIIVGTVDMIGSRLLFEGYGVSRKMRPYHAGLLGADTLVVLDEAHLVPPFEKLLEVIEARSDSLGPREERERTIVRRFRLLSLSATGRVRKGTLFRLNDDDLADNVVQKRLLASKTVKIVEIGDEKDALAEALARQAWERSDQGRKAIRCLVYCDSREIAKKTEESIRALANGDRRASVPKTEIETELFVGARRVKEREDARERLTKLGFLAGGDVIREKPAFLIATSAGEVGVDLDSDHMVCDLVPWERMVQRLGRVNRRGDGNATIILVRGPEPKPKKPDVPTEREKIDMVAHRSLALVKALPNSAQGYDASPGALRTLKLRAERDEDLAKTVEAATTPEPLRPALTRAVVDAWSMTSLEEHTGRPAIQPWLRGWIEDEPQTSVSWRTYLPVRKQGGAAVRVADKEIEAFFEAAPPHLSELLETETWRVADWIVARARSAARSGERESFRAADVEAETASAELGMEQADEPNSSLKPDDIVAFALDRAGDLHRSYRLGDLARKESRKDKEGLVSELNSAILVLDARLGGLSRQGLLDDGEVSLPLTADFDDEWSRAAGFRVRRRTASDETEHDENWRVEAEFASAKTDEGDVAEWLIVERFGAPKNSEEGRSISRPQSLVEHQSWAEQKARMLAKSVGLTGDHAEALAIAARVHDEGKRAVRWQQAFNAQRAPDDIQRPLAKTRGPFVPKILDGYRHEFGSLPRAETDAAFGKLRERNPDLADLVLHLIASHHGQARPVIETRSCEDAPPSALKGRARDVALRFARLQGHWGPWGLAWWEALLRAADQQASRDNDEGRGLPDPSTEER